MWWTHQTAGNQAQVQPCLLDIFLKAIDGIRRTYSCIICPEKRDHEDKIILQTPSVVVVVSAKQHQDLSVDSMNYQTCIFIFEFPFNLISQLNYGFLNRSIRACTQNGIHRLGPRIRILVLFCRWTEREVQFHCSLLFQQPK